MRTHALLLSACVLIATALPARADAFDDACEAARAKQLPALIELARWCHDQKLFASRDELARRILEADPRNVQAHQWLRHRLGPGGRWEAPSRPPATNDSAGAAALEQFAETRTRLLRPIAEELDAALVQHRPNAAPGLREAVQQEILALVPDDAEFRVLHGEVLGPQGWRLQETVSGERRRKALTDAARAALAAVPAPRSATVLAELSRSGLRWRAALAFPNMLVFATTSRPEAERIGQACEALPGLLRTALGIESSLLPGFTVFALEGPDDGHAFRDAHPDVSADARRIWDEYGSLWLGGTGALATYQRLPAWRVESPCGMAFRTILRQQFDVKGTRAPFAMEGFEKRLVWELVGTRTTYSQRESEYADDAGGKRRVDMSADAAWYARAAELLQELGPADLAERMGRPLNLLDGDDRVLGNAIAAYYLEGRPAECGAYLTALGEGASPEDALRKASDLDIEALRLRMIRWLGERN